MAITVAMDDLLADWRTAWATDSETVKLRFTPQGIPPVQDPLGARRSIEEALDHACARAEENGFPDDFPPAIHSVCLIEGGFGLTGQAESETAVSLLLPLVIDELVARGWSGQLAPRPFVDVQEPPLAP